MAVVATAEKESTYQVRALERGLSIVETLADAGEALSLSEIAKRHDLNLSTAFRLVRVLTQLRWLESDDQTNLYRLAESRIRDRRPLPGPTQCQKRKLGRSWRLSPTEPRGARRALAFFGTGCGLYRNRPRPG